MSLLAWPAAPQLGVSGLDARRPHSLRWPAVLVRGRQHGAGAVGEVSVTLCCYSSVVRVTHLRSRRRLDLCGPCRGLRHGVEVKSMAEDSWRDVLHRARFRILKPENLLGVSEVQCLDCVRLRVGIPAIQRWRTSVCMHQGRGAVRNLCLKFLQRDRSGLTLDDCPGHCSLTLPWNPTC